MTRKSSPKSATRSVTSTTKKSATKKKKSGKKLKSDLYFAMSPEAKVWFVEKFRNGKEEVTEIDNEVVLQCVVHVLTLALEEWAKKLEAEQAAKANKPADAPGDNCSDCSSPCRGGHEPRVDEPVKREGQITAKQPKLRKTDN